MGGAAGAGAAAGAGGAGGMNPAALEALMNNPQMAAVRQVRCVVFAVETVKLTS